MKDDHTWLWILGGAFIIYLLQQQQKALAPITTSNLAANTQISNAQAIENAILAGGNAATAVYNAV